MRRLNSVTITSAIIGATAVGGHALLWLSYSYNWGVPWQPVTSIALAVTSITAFGGFYLASRRVRVAIATAFILTYLIALTYAFSLSAFAESLYNGPVGNLFKDFFSQVTTVVAFYLGAEAVISGSKVISAGRTSAEEARKADQDLVSPCRLRERSTLLDSAWAARDVAAYTTHSRHAGHGALTHITLQPFPLHISS